MEYLKLLTKLAKTEKSYQYDEIIELLKHPVEFEEIPLITRTGREKPFLKMLSPPAFVSVTMPFSSHKNLAFT